MRAMIMKEPGPADAVFELVDDRPEPDPRKLGEHDLLVEVKAAAMNPVDYKIRRGGYPIQREFPIVLGFDVSGVVKAKGDAVEGFAIGDEVYASPALSRDGANAELVAIDARSTAHKPGSLSHAEAAALPLVTLTSWEALHDRARMHPGQTVLIHAGAGGTGHIGIQLAKQHGCRVITTASQPDSIALCEQLGADVIINYREEDVNARVMEETDGDGCAIVYDTVGGQVFTDSLDLIAINGCIVGIVGIPKDAPVEKIFRKNASLHMEFMGIAGIYGINREHHASILETAAEMADAGALKPHLHGTYGLEDLPAIHQRQEDGHVVGKQVIEVG